MFGLRAAPLAVFLEFYFAGNQLAVLARPIINTAALRACEFDELVLGHMGETIRQRRLPRNLLTEGVPRKDRCADKRAHYNVHDEPTGQNDDESDRYIAEYLFRF